MPGPEVTGSEVRLGERRIRLFRSFGSHFIVARLAPFGTYITILNLTSPLSDKLLPSHCHG
jgi:hypothetical protein